MKRWLGLVLGFGALIVTALVVNYLLIASLGRRALAEHAMEQVASLSAMLVKADRYGLGVEGRAEDLLGSQMIVHAMLAANLVDVAENYAHMSPEQINERLKRIADSTVLDEFWITDEKGHAYLRNREEIDFTFPSQPTQRSQAYEFWHLLEAKGGQFVQGAMEREYDGLVYKYAAVSGIDKPRIVQVGYDAKSLDRFAAGLTVDDLTRALVGEGGIRRVVAIGQEGQLYLDTDLPGNPDEGAKVQDFTLRALAKRALDVRRSVTILEGEQLIVASPSRGAGQGAHALVAVFDARPILTTIRQAILTTVILTGGLLTFGIALAFQAARRVARESLDQP